MAAAPRSTPGDDEPKKDRDQDHNPDRPDLSDTVRRLKRRLAREKQAREEAEQIAESATQVAIQDPLTGLANRALIMRNLEREIDRARRRNSTVGLLFLDLNGFKLVNDTYGHDSGDRLLVVVADALRLCTRGEDSVGRLGGDEFVVIATEAGSMEATAMADRILEATEKTVGELGVAGATTSASIGIVVLDGSVDADEALKQADMAMYEAKRSAAARWQVFDENMRRISEQKRIIRRDLPPAIASREIDVHYQPIIERDTDGVDVRGPRPMARPLGGFRSPMEFIPTAEESGVIHALGKLILEKALADTAQYRKNFEQSVSPVAVNVSPHQLRMPHFRVDARNDAQRLRPRRIVTSG